MKTFILLSALPGAGKSTWAEQYRLSHNNVKIVSSDTLRKEITGEYQNFEHEEEVWDKYYSLINEYAEKNDDITVIADSTNLRNYVRRFYVERVKGYDHTVLIVFKKDLETLLKQNQVRIHSQVVPEHVIKSMYESWEDPSEDVIDFFDEYVVIYKWFDSSKVKRSFHFKE